MTLSARVRQIIAEMDARRAAQKPIDPHLVQTTLASPDMCSIRCRCGEVAPIDEWIQPNQVFRCPHCGTAFRRDAVASLFGWPTIKLATIP